MVFPQLEQTIATLTAEVNLIPEHRRAVLLRVAQFVKKQKQSGQPAVFNFICTHNSRRSHMAQLWAQVAAYYHGVGGVVCLSGGTEATAFNPQAVAAMQRAGFQIEATTTGANPRYEVRFSEDAPAVLAFSKTYDDPFNHTKAFAAVMTCVHADEHCPFIPHALERIALTYDDPKAYDGTPEAAARYTERTLEIGRELVYAFSQVKEL